jgi:serine/threonine protein kinase
VTDDLGTGAGAAGEQDDGLPAHLRIVAEVGDGASAVVYRARDARSGQVVALKLWRAPLDDDTRKYFLREVEALRALDGHPHVVRIKEAEAAPGARAWLTMELCEESLSGHLRRGPVEREQAFRIADDVLSGLAAVHAAGHLHRDVKPQNVLLTGGRAKLGDLGLARTHHTATTTGASGSGPYLAPELAHEPPSVRSDIYAAAVTIQALFGDDPRPDVDRLLVRASSSRPSDRPPDAETFRRELRAAGDEATGASPAVGPRSAAPPTSTGPADGDVPEDRPVAPSSRRRRLRLAALAVPVSLIVTGAALWGAALAGDDHPENDPVTQAALPSAGTTTLPGGVLLTPTPATGTPTELPTAGSTALPGGGDTGGGAPEAGDTEGPGGTALPGPNDPEDNPATQAPKTGEEEGSGSSGPSATEQCKNASNPGSLEIGDGGQNSGGPNWVPEPCTSIYLKLTEVHYITYARACPEQPDGTPVSCGDWIFLHDGGAWNRLLTGVHPGDRWKLDLKAEGPGRVRFMFSG